MLSERDLQLAGCQERQKVADHISRALGDLGDVPKHVLDNVLNIFRGQAKTFERVDQLGCAGRIAVSSSGAKVVCDANDCPLGG